MKSLLKEKPVQVFLTQEDLTALDKAVIQIRRERKDTRVGRGTLLREYAMPHIRELVEAA